MKVEQFEPGFYRVRDNEGYAIKGVVIGGYGRWHVRFDGEITPGFTTKRSAISFLISRNK